MRQTLHILMKDVRYLWLEIVVVIAAAAAHAVTEWRFEYFMARNRGLTSGALTLAALFLIVRLIHAESIGGDRQFWITRPYHWKSLVAAKAAFLALFLNLPIFLIRLAVLTAMGSPLSASLPPLLWSHFTLTAVAGLSAAALAAMTSGLISFALSAFVLVVALPVFGITLLHSWAVWPDTIEWIRELLLGAGWAGVMLTILVIQYKSRRTAVSRAMGIAAIAVVAVLYWALPPSWGLALQAVLPFGNSASAARFAAVDIRLYRPEEKSPTNAWNVGVEVQGPDNDVNSVVDGFRIELKADDGRTWNSGWWVFGPQHSGSIDIDPAFVEAVRKTTLTLRASVYATVFGDAQPPFPISVTQWDDQGSEYAASLRPFPYSGSGLLCTATVFGGLTVDQTGYQGQNSNVECRTAVGFSRLIVTADRVSRNGTTLRHAYTFPWFSAVRSYSPFPPGDGSLYLLARDSAVSLFSEEPGLHSANPVALNAGDQVVLNVRKPIAHFRRDIVQRVQLEDPVPRK